MRAFAQLIDSLTYTRSRLAKVRLIADYLQAVPDPDRGWAMAALTGDIDLPTVKSAAVRGLIEERTDPILFRLSRDYVGDTAETVALLWPLHDPTGNDEPPLRLATVVDQLRQTTRAAGPPLLASMLDQLPTDERYALLKLATGALRVGISGRLARTAMAEAFALDADAVEELWHGLEPPYAELFAWAEGRAEKPDPGLRPVFRPFMLAHPLDDPGAIYLDAFVAEWKWDGIRVQVAASGGVKRLFSRAGEDISGSFPDIVEAIGSWLKRLKAPVVLDGEIVALDETGRPSFSRLQQRFGIADPARAEAAARVVPASFVVFDLLHLGGHDAWQLPYRERRALLEQLVDPEPPLLLSPSGEGDGEHWLEAAREQGIEGVMAKRLDRPYEPGRRSASWRKVKIRHEQEFAVCGWTRGQGRRTDSLGALVLGGLIYVGASVLTGVGAGIVEVGDLRSDPVVAHLFAGDAEVKVALLLLDGSLPLAPGDCFVISTYTYNGCSGDP